MGRKWFKHYANSTDGESIRTLWDTNDFESICCFWRLLEIACQLENASLQGEIVLNKGVLQHLFGWKMVRIRRVFRVLEGNSQIVISDLSNNTIKIEIKNFLKYQTRWGGKRKARWDQDESQDEVKMGGRLDLDLDKERQQKSAVLDLDETQKAKAEILALVRGMKRL